MTDGLTKPQVAMRHLVITVHGIRTYGAWQERLEALVIKAAAGSGQSLTVVNYKYGYFSAFAILSMIFRGLEVKRFRRALDKCLEGSWDRVDIVGHSFGTYLVAKALLSLRGKTGRRVDTVIFSGSVLPAAFPWTDIVPAVVSRLVNECGTIDRVLWLSQPWPFLGMAGRTGFLGMTGASLRNRFFSIGHSGYFEIDGGPSDSFMQNHWIPLVLGTAEVPAIDERRPHALAGVEAFLHHHARATKLLVYALVLWVVLPQFRWLWATGQLMLDGATVTQTEDGLKVAYNDDVAPRRSLKWLSALGAVRALDLTRTKITDDAFKEIEPNPGLRTLEIFGTTTVTRRILPELSRFPGLVKLDIEAVPLGGLSGFPWLRNLQTLDLTKTGIHDEDLAALATLTQLRELDLDGNAITGTGLRYLAQLSSLVELVLDRTNLTDEGLENLPVLPNLKELYLQDEKLLRGPGLRKLSSLRNLQSLSIAFSTVDGENLKYVSSLTNLEEFRAPGVPIGSIGLQPFAALRNLRRLYLGGMEIADTDLVHLTNLHHLETLFLPANPKITLAGIKPLLKLQSLKKLNIDDTGVTAVDRDAIRSARPDIVFQHLK